MEAEFRRDCVGNLGCVMHLGGYVKRGVHLNETKDAKFWDQSGVTCTPESPCVKFNEEVRDCCVSPLVNARLSKNYHELSVYYWMV